MIQLFERSQIPVLCERPTDPSAEKVRVHPLASLSKSATADFRQEGHGLLSDNGAAAKSCARLASADWESWIAAAALPFPFTVILPGAIFLYLFC